MRRVLVLLILCLSVGCTKGTYGSWSGFEPDVGRWGDEQLLQVGDHAFILRPYLRDRDDQQCMARLGGGVASGECFVADDWVVELNARTVEGGTILTGVAHDNVVDVVVPLVGGGVLHLTPEEGLGGRRILAVTTEEVDLSDPNAIAGYDAAGNKLGNQHWNRHTDGCNDAGPWDGSEDAAHASPVDCSSGTR